MLDLNRGSVRVGRIDNKTKIIELNSEDYSLKDVKSINLKELDFIVITAYFELREDALLETINSQFKSIDIPVLSGGERKVIHLKKF